MSTPAPRWIARFYRAAAIYGVLVLAPLYLLPAPPVAPENYYGFVGTALVFQLAFWVIGGDPVRYRALMPVSVLEKLAFAVPVAILVAQGRTAPLTLVFAAIDLALGIGFALAWRACPRAMSLSYHT